MCRALPFDQRSLYLSIAAFASTCTISGLAWLAMCEVWNSASNALGKNWAGITINSTLTVTLICVGFTFYLISLLAYDVLIAFENLREADQRQAAAQLMARDAELQMLRMQINPHFLFNSLNSISALTSMDAEKARAMTIELAQFFRQTLSLSGQNSISVEQELALCGHFLSIEKIRFGKKLNIDMHIDPSALPCLIPPMLLQPLIENSLKHGIRNLSDGGTLHVQCHTQAQWLHIAIDNPVDANPSTSHGNGTGLSNITARLRASYGDQAKLRHHKTATHFFVEITLPRETTTS